MKKLALSLASVGLIIGGAFSGNYTEFARSPSSIDALAFSEQAGSIKALGGMGAFCWSEA